MSTRLPEDNEPIDENAILDAQHRADGTLPPWTEPVDGAAHLYEIVGKFNQHLVLNDGVPETLALYSLNAHAKDIAEIAPRLYLKSPVKGCGKSTIIDIMAQLMPNARPVAGISRANLYDSISTDKIIPLIDEADFSVSKPLYAVLHAGHSRQSCWVRVGVGASAKDYNVFGPVVVGGIGDLIPQLEDRSIRIPLDKPRPADRLPKFYGRRAIDVRIMQRKCAKWVADNAGVLEVYEPAMPELTNHRAVDNWTPLVAIADICAADAGLPYWSVRAREIAVMFSGAPEQISEAETLIADIRTLCRTTDPDNPAPFNGIARIKSTDLCDALTRMEGHLWACLNPTKMAAILVAFADGRGSRICPNQLRFGFGRGAENRNGYEDWQFVHAFERYGLAPGSTQSTHPTPDLDEIARTIAEIRGQLAAREARRQADEEALRRHREEEAAALEARRASTAPTPTAEDQVREDIARIKAKAASTKNGTDGEPDPEPPTPPRRGRGRPKGSKNKVKANGATDPNHGTNGAAPPQGETGSVAPTGAATSSWGWGFNEGGIPPIQTPLAEAAAALRATIAAGKTNGIKKVLEGWERLKPDAICKAFEIVQIEHIKRKHAAKEVADFAAEVEGIQAQMDFEKSGVMSPEDDAEPEPPTQKPVDNPAWFHSADDD